MLTNASNEKKTRRGRCKMCDHKGFAQFQHASGPGRASL